MSGQSLNFTENHSTLGRTRGGGWILLPSEVFLRFFLDDQISAPGVFSSCSSILRTYFETSLVMMVTKYDVMTS